MDQVLKVKNYSLDFVLPKGKRLRALSNIDLSVAKGEVLGLVGESGSGKTTLSWAVMRYLAENAREVEGEITFMGESLLDMSPGKLGSLRGGKLGMIFQDPSASLNPTLTIGEQVTESLVLHRAMDKKQALDYAGQILSKVDLKDPLKLMKRYPHQASGGEKQRVLIATAFACEPECLIFDEPTTALDVISAAQILKLFDKLREQTGVAALYISHDLALVSQVSDRVMVLDKGQVVETAPTQTIFHAPAQLYTRQLIDAVPNPRHRLVDESGVEATELMSMHGISVDYGRQTLWDSIFRRKSPRFAALKPLELSLRKGEILGVVGESGSGKSTLAKALFGLVPFNGRLSLDKAVFQNAEQMGKDYRRRLQLIFQHPDSSLNPRQTIGDILARPLRLYGDTKKGRERAAIAALLEQVDLPAEFYNRYPHELSGGQKQRVAIARAFASRPEIVVCDEITAALDVSVQAKVIKLLLDLRKSNGTTYLFITHDLNLIRQIAHRVVVMYRGELVEVLSAENGFENVEHPYTKELLAAASLPVSVLNS